MYHFRLFVLRFPSPEKSRFLCSLTLSCALSPFAPRPSMVNSVVRNTSRGIVRDARPWEVVLYYSIVPRILQEVWGMLQSLILEQIYWYTWRSRCSDCGAVSKEKRFCRSYLFSRIHSSSYSYFILPDATSSPTRTTSSSDG